MAQVQDVTDSTFDRDVVKSGKIVVVHFCSASVSACRMLAPTLEELAGEYAGRITFVRIDVDANQQTPALYGVKALPTLMAFKSGQIAGQILGLRPKSDIKNALDGL